MTIVIGNSEVLLISASFPSFSLRLNIFIPFLSFFACSPLDGSATTRMEIERTEKLGFKAYTSGSVKIPFMATAYLNYVRCLSWLHPCKFYLQGPCCENSVMYLC